jgi:hypothetical protein
MLRLSRTIYAAEFDKPIVYEGRYRFIKRQSLAKGVVEDLSDVTKSRV